MNKSGDTNDGPALANLTERAEPWGLDSTVAPRSCHCVADRSPGTRVRASDSSGAPGRATRIAIGSTTPSSYPTVSSPPTDGSRFGAGHAISAPAKLLEPFQSIDGGMPASPGLRQ